MVPSHRESEKTYALLLIQTKYDRKAAIRQSDREKKTDRKTGKNKFSSSTKLLPSVTQENKKSLKVNFIIKNHF